MFLIKKKSYAIGIICIFILSSLAALPTEGLNIITSLESNKNTGIKTVEGDGFIDMIPDYVKPGDLYFCECKYSDLEPGWDHVGIYIGNNEFVEAVSKGVRITNLSAIQNWTKDITFGTVKTSNEVQRQNAIEFTVSQLGKPYDPFKRFFRPWFNRPKDPSPDAEAWYCSELVWAAYYNQGIDIDRSGNISPYVGVTEISSDGDVEMYTYHKLNRNYLGRNIEWLIKTIINAFEYYF